RRRGSGVSLGDWRKIRRPQGAKSRADSPKISGRAAETIRGHSPLGRGAASVAEQEADGDNSFETAGKDSHGPLCAFTRLTRLPGTTRAHTGRTARRLPQ